MKKIGLGELKVLLQNYGVNIAEDIKKEVLEKFNCYHVNYGKIFFNIIDNYENLHPVYTIVSNSQLAYILKKDDNGYYLWKDNMSIRIQLNERIKSYDYMIDGKKVCEIARIKSRDHLALTLNHYCMHFNGNRQCKFCNISGWPTNINKSHEDYLKAIKIYSDNKEVSHLSITTATVNSTDKGLRSVLSFVEKIRSSGIELPIAIEFEPTNEYQYLNELKSLGVVTVSCNIEMLQDDIRPLLMPGKGQIKIEEYYMIWEKCVALFGKNQVYTNVLLNSIEYNRKKIINQLKTISGIGVIPSLGLLLPEKNTELEDVKFPDINRQYEYHFINNQYIFSNGLNPLEVKAGCPRNGSYSPVKEFYIDTLYKDRCVIENYEPDYLVK